MIMSRNPNPNPNARASRIIRILLRLLQRRYGFYGESWPESIMPPSGEVHVVVDGLASTSSNSGSYVPWFDQVAGSIEHLASNGVVIGFSYSQPGRHYGPPETNIALLTYAEQLFRPYVPTLEHGQKVTYIGFSLGASLIAIGLGAFLEQIEQEADRRLGDSVPALIMVQPALALGEAYLEAAQSADEELPAVIGEFSLIGEKVQTRLVTCLAAIVGAGIPVFLVHWPGDRFAIYPEELMAQIQSVGVTRVPVTPHDIPDGDEFLQHCRIAGDPSILLEIQRIIGEINPQE